MGARGDDDLLIECVEFRGHARKEAGGHLRAVRVAMELLVRGFANPRARRVRLAGEQGDPLLGQ